MEKLPFRQIHLDFHTSPFIGDVGKDFDAKTFAKTLKDAHVNSINIFAKGHHGMCYYPTKLGKVHPALKFDLLGEMITACHAEGIKVPIYYAVGWEEEAAKNVDWLEVDMDGVLGRKGPFETGYYRWKKLCLNKKGYIDYILAQTQELIDLYEGDGLWYDIIVQDPCVCQDCQESMREKGLDPQNKEDVKKQADETVQAFMKTIYEYVKSKKPDLLVFFNRAYTPDGGYDSKYSIKQKTQYNTHIEIESLPSEIWGYNHFPLFVNYYNHREQQVIGMNGKFHTAWGDFGSLRNEEALEYECFRMIANGTKCCIGDQLHPRGVLDPTVYQRIGAIYGQIKEKEAWCENVKKVAKIGVISSNPCLEKNSDSDEGIMRMLMELHQPFDFIDFLDDFSKYELMILPDHVMMKEEHAQKIEAYITAGGKVIATYHSGMDEDLIQFLVPSFGVSYLQEDPHYPGFVKVLDKGSKLSSFNYVMYERGTLVDIKGETEVLAKLGRPYFNRTYDRFCSHQYFPFETVTEHGAMTRLGNVIYLSHPIFKDYIQKGARICRELFEYGLKLLNVRPIIKSNLPSTAEVTVMDQGDKRIVHIIHYIPQRKSRTLDIVDTKIPLYHIELEVELENAPKRVYLAPSKEEISFTWKEGYVSINVPQVMGHEMVVLEK